jgi:hypothetical protein
MVFIVKSGTFQATQKNLNHTTNRPGHPSIASKPVTKKPKELMLFEKGQIFGEESHLNKQDDEK